VSGRSVSYCRTASDYIFHCIPDIPGILKCILMWTMELISICIEVLQLSKSDNEVSRVPHRNFMMTTPTTTVTGPHTNSSNQKNHGRYVYIYISIDNTHAIVSLLLITM
jgi:hypothetical protein